MSRKKYRVRDKVTRKMTKDGLVERNAVTGKETRISKRETDLDLSSKTPEHERYSQVGNTPAKKRKKGAYRQPETTNDTGEQTAPQPYEPQNPDTPLRYYHYRDTEQAADTSDTPAQQTTQVADTDKPSGGKLKLQRNTSYRQRESPALQHDIKEMDTPRTQENPPSTVTQSTPAPTASDTQTQPESTPDAPNAAPSPSSGKPESALKIDKPDKLHFSQNETATNPAQQPIQAADTNKPTNSKSGSWLNMEINSRLTRAADEAAPVPREKPKHRKQPQQPKSYVENAEPPAVTEAVKPSEPRKVDSAAKPDSDTTPRTAAQPADTPTPSETVPPPKPSPESDNAPLQTDKPETPLKIVKPGKLQFAPDEATPDTPKLHRDQKLNKAQAQADRSAAKLERAQARLPQKRKLRSERVFDEEKGKSKRRLYFESEVKPQAEHIKGTLPLRPVKAAGHSVLALGHRKIYQVEHENVGTKAAHRSEMLVEGGVRTALRFRKTAPYRKTAKLERKVRKKSIHLSYQKALAENPKLKSNLLSRAFQKRKIKKDYAKAARKAQKAVGQARKAGTVTGKAAKALTGIVTRHPVAAAAIVLIALLLYAILSLIGAFGGLGSGGLGGLLTMTYLAEDEDMDSAALLYTEQQTDLRTEINDTENDYPGYDEYRYNIGEINHNPYELMAYLTAMYHDFSFTAIEQDLRTLFDEQYSLTFTPSAETRYADPTDSNRNGDYEPYEWQILTVSLTAQSLGDVVLSHMNAERLAHYTTLIQSKGNRQYLANPFGDMNWLPNVTSHYGYRIHPISSEKNLHRGIDIGFPAGTEIHSVQNGTVTFAGYNGGYGNVVVIEDDEGLVGKYAHCESLLVSTGQSVNVGDIIAAVGSTGNSTGPHLHFEVMKNGRYINPLFYADTGHHSTLDSVSEHQGGTLWQT